MARYKWLFTQYFVMVLNEILKQSVNKNWIKEEDEHKSTAIATKE